MPPARPRPTLARRGGAAPVKPGSNRHREHAARVARCSQRAYPSCDLDTRCVRHFAVPCARICRLRRVAPLRAPSAAGPWPARLHAESQRPRRARPCATAQEEPSSSLRPPVRFPLFGDVDNPDGNRRWPAAATAYVNYHTSGDSPEWVELSGGARGWVQITIERSTVTDRQVSSAALR